MPAKTWYCYVLQSKKNKRSYVGCTVNVSHRLRQHNEEICGGAISTHGRGPWIVIKSTRVKKRSRVMKTARGEAQRVEKWIKKGRKVDGRLKRLLFYKKTGSTPKRMPLTKKKKIPVKKVC